MTDQHVLVTGGSRGIGAAVVRRLLSDGHRVTFTHRKDDEAAGGLTTDAPRSLAIRADVADTTLVEAVFSAAEARSGPVTHLVNNAGITGRLSPFALSTDATTRRREPYST